MPGLESKCASKPANGAPTPASMSNNKPGRINGQAPVPAFGYSSPSVPASVPAPPRSNTKPSSRAEIAGKAAAKRMDELQAGSNTFSKPDLYEKYGTPNPPQGRSSSLLPPPRIARPTTETTEEKRARFHKLFNKWVPRADEFYKSYGTLDLSVEELEAIQDEIVSYCVNSALAAGKHTVYKASWETAPQYLPPQRQVRGEAMDDDAEDPFGLGLTSSPVLKGKGDRVPMDLLD